MKKICCAVVMAACVALPALSFADTAVHSANSQKAATQPAQQHPGEEAGKIPQGVAKDMVVAKVNGATITLPSLIRMMHTMSARQKEPARKPEEMKALRKKALDRLVFEELAYQEATARGVKAAPAEIDRQLEDLRTKLGGAEKLAQILAEKGLTEDELRSRIARNIVLQRIFQEEIYDKVTVSDEEVQQRYEKDKFRVPGKAIVTDIVFFLDPDKLESLRKAQKILDKLRKEKVPDPHKLVPDGTFVVTDAEVSDKQEPELFEYAKKVKPGELSDVIRTSDSVHILLVKEYTPEKQYTFDQVKGYLKAKIGSEEHLARMHEWERQLKKGADIEMPDIGDAGLEGAAGGHGQ
jgi:parvulin-like peptidyl-prolyl isomerase